MKTRRTKRTKRRASGRKALPKRNRSLAAEGLAASKLTGKALRESEERYRSLFENSMLAISQASLDGKLIRVNKAYARMYGYASPEEMMAAVPDVGQLYADPEDRKEVLRILSEKGVVGPREISVVHRDGKRFYVEVLAQEIRDAAGRLCCYQASHMDITERKRAEAEARLLAQRFTLATDASGIGVWDWDLISDRVYANPTYFTMLGYDPAEARFFSRELWLERVHPEDRTAVAEKIQAASAGGDGRYEYEARIRHADGSYRWIHVVGRVLMRDAQGKASRLLGTREDITERKQTLEALRASEERYRLLFEASADGIIMVGRDGLITRANDAQSRMFHYGSPEEMVGMSPNLLVTPAMREFGRDIMRRRLRGEETPPVEYRLLRKDGTEFWGEVSAAILRNTSGSVTGYTCITHDTTKRKRTEELLRESELQFRSLFEQAPIAISVSRNGRGVFANQAVVRTFGLRDAEEWVGRQTFEWYAPQCQGEIKERTRRRLLGLPVPAEFESVGLRPDGSQFPIHVSVRQVQLADGPANLAFITDITERKQAETALRENAERLSQILEATSGGVWDWNIPSGKAVFSPGYSGMLGYSPDEFATAYASWKDLVHPDDFERVNQELHDHFHKNKEFSIEFRMREKSGRWHWVHSRGILVERDKQGNPLRMVGTHSAIQERKQAEAVLRELSGRLLRLEDDERQRIARELHDTTAQELAAISMNLAVLKARAPELKAGAQAVLAETIALTDRCASEVRTMSYLLHPPALEALGLAGAGRDYIDGFARRSGIRVDLQISDDLGRFPAETERALFRVLQESLANIHRHSGSRTASIQLTRTTDQIRLEVRDAGRGMKKTNDPLAEGPPAGGLGVGIPGMRERMRQVGGQLQIQSDPQGTCVIATMPVDRQTDQP